MMFKVQVRFAVVVALVLLVGCSGPAPGQPPKASTSDPFAALRTRPLKLPPLAAGQPCPKAELRDLGAHLEGALGDGPVYLFGVNLRDLRTGRPSKVVWGAAPTYNGPIRIRGGRTDGAGQVLLESFDNRWRGTPLKTVDGSDLVPELDLLESHSTFPNVPPGWRMWPSQTYIAPPGCYAWQVDGISFTEVITIQI
jgi:hypothetical protein